MADNSKEAIELSNGVRMPRMGLGVFKVDPDDVRTVVYKALGMGYRLVDTAQAYGNERGVGDAIRASDVPRDQLFVTTKMMRNVGEKDAQADFERSLGELGLDYVDLCLVHMPFGDVYGTWRVLERELRRGRVRAIGVSNFDPVRLQDLISNAEVAPMVNQYQSNPYAPAEAVAGFCRMHGIAFQAWGPLGQGKSRLLSDPVLEGIAQAHGCSVAQAVLAWQLGRGIAVVAKSTHEERLRQNLEATRFSLTPEEMLTVSALAKPEEAGMLDNPAFVAHLCAGWHEDA